MNTMKSDWRKAVTRTLETAIVVAACGFAVSASAATTCQVGASLLPVDAHKGICQFADLDTNGMALKR